MNEWRTLCVTLWEAGTLWFPSEADPWGVEGRRGRVHISELLELPVQLCGVVGGVGYLCAPLVAVLCEAVHGGPLGGVDGLGGGGTVGPSPRVRAGGAARSSDPVLVLVVRHLLLHLLPLLL